MVKWFVRNKTLSTSQFRTRRKTSSPLQNFFALNFIPCYYPSLQDFVHSTNQGRKMDSMITFRWDTSFPLIHKLQCLSVIHFLVYSLVHLLFHTYAYFHNHRPCHYSQLEVPSLDVRLTQNPISCWLAFFTLPKHQKSAGTLDRLHAPFWGVSEFSQRYQLDSPVRNSNHQKFVLYSFHAIGAMKPWWIQISLENF